MERTVSIRPGVRVLSVLRHLNYKPWFALAEFVDNSLQSFLQNRNHLEALHGKEIRCRVSIKLEQDPPRITIRDNAAGISESEYGRAFRPAEIPTDRSGLSEFGMGMKSAACWFAPSWQVRTSALGEPGEKTIRFEIDEIVADSIEELVVASRPGKVDDHFTEVVLSNLYKTPVGSTIKKIKDHLASIYRMFLRGGDLELEFNDERLTYESPKILVVQKHDEPNGKAVRWYKELDFDFGLGLSATGFAALRERGNTSDAGFALFRRHRLIEGSADEGYRPELIFGRSNSYRYQRLFGELELQGFNVSHTKDGFQWDENEETFLRFLKDELSHKDLPLLEQAEQYRSRVVREEAAIRAEAYGASERTAGVIERDAPAVLEQLKNAPSVAEPAKVLPLSTHITRREIDVELSGHPWRVVLEMTDDPAVGNWVELADGPITGANSRAKAIRPVGVRLSLAHPFTTRFMGTDGTGLEPLLRLAAAIGLAEVAARSAGVRQAGIIRRNINELLRSALANS
ncbi:MAG: ATP-binding protein [Gemmatimonadaceae bacterium]